MTSTFTCSYAAQKKSLMQCHDDVKHVWRISALKLNFMWMLKPLLLGRETQWQKGPETPRPLHHPQHDKKKRHQSYNWHLNNKSLLTGCFLAIQIPDYWQQQHSAETDKNNKYAAGSNKSNLTFHLLVMDVYGCGIPPNTVHYVLNPHIQTGSRTLCHQIVLHSQLKTYWYQRLFVTIWTFNAYKAKLQSGIY